VADYNYLYPAITIGNAYIKDNERNNRPDRRE
jgi:hypothetical protein